MEQPSAATSVVQSAAMVEKLAVGLDPISCVYPNCRSSVPVELFNVHLARCRRKWLGPAATCTYNGAHVVPAPEERYHEVTCPDRWLNGEISECKEKLQELAKSSSRSGTATAKKPGCESTGVSSSRPQTSYSYRDGSYLKWRNVGSRSQRQLRQYESEWYESTATAGRGQRSPKWQKPSVTGFRDGHRPSRGTASVGYRTRESKAPSVSVPSSDDLPASPIYGFSPWGSSKSQLALIGAARWNSATRARGSASLALRRQQAFK